MLAARVPHKVKATEVHFTPDEEVQLNEIATRAGTDSERLVKDSALRLLEGDDCFRAAVREGVAQADRGRAHRGRRNGRPPRAAIALLTDAHLLDAGRGSGPETD